MERDWATASAFRPHWTLPGLGRRSRAIGVLSSLASGPAGMPEQLGHVYDGIFLLLRQSGNLRHPQLDPLTLDRHPVLAGLPSPGSGPAVFTGLFWNRANIQC